MNGVDQRDEARNVDGDGAASADECDVGAYEAPFVAPPSICPAPDNELTTLVGVGMGDTKKSILRKKLNVPNANNLVALYGQMVAKDISKPVRRARGRGHGRHLGLAATDHRRTGRRLHPHRADAGRLNRPGPRLRGPLHRAGRQPVAAPLRAGCRPQPLPAGAGLRRAGRPRRGRGALQRRHRRRG